MARATTGWPVLSAESGSDNYFKEIQRFPMLDRQEEFMLAKRWREDRDRDAAHLLVTSHLRLVTKIARSYRGYGLPIADDLIIRFSCFLICFELPISIRLLLSPSPGTMR
jgi:DNA-directed RNA polymerase sigma subunit (sigma70/sigma32)